MNRTYDSKCWDLAEHFLADQPDATAEDRDELAYEIQLLVEGFVADLHQ